jgi:hypothetical protein
LGLANLLAVEPDRERMTLMVKPAVVFVYSDIQVGVTLHTTEGPIEFDPVPMNSMGSGFIVNSDGYVVTNGHVVERYHSKDNNKLKQEAVIFILEQYIFPQFARNNGRPPTQEEMVNIYQNLLPNFSFKIAKQLFVFLSNWEKYPAEVKQFSPPISFMPGKTEGIVSYEEEEAGKDIAILKIEKGDLPTVPLGDSDDVRLQEPAFPAGYPGVVAEHNYLSSSTMLESSFTSGHVSSLKVDVKGTPVIQFDASVTWGNSGGPVFNDRGEVIGIATFISLKSSGQGAMPIQGFNFAVPINTAKEFIRSAGVTPNSGHFNSMWRDALELYFDEDYEDLVIKCDEILRMYPNQPDVRRIQVKSQKELLANPPSVFKKIGQYWWVLLIVLVVVVGLVVTVVLVGRAGRSKAAPRPPAAGGDLKATTVDVHSSRQRAGTFGRLVCEKGAVQGKNWEVPQAGLSIGRDPSQNTVVVPDDHVSKVHATVTPTSQGLMVEDKNSTNGTFINQVGAQGIRQQVVKSGDRIILGSKQAAIFRIE